MAPRRARAVLVALLAFALALLCAEAVLRLAPPRRAWNPGGNHPRFLFEPDSDAGYRLRAGFEGREIAVSGEFDLAVRIGADGTREQARPFGARSGILALGDSMTFGEGVAAEQTWAALLSERVREPVINAGVPGYSTRQMAAALPRAIERYQPRAVLVVFSPRWDLARCLDPFVYKEGFIVAASYAPSLWLAGYGRYENWLTAHVHLARYLAGRRYAARHAERRKIEPPRWTEHPECLAGLQAVRKHLEARVWWRAVLLDSPAHGHAADVRALSSLLDAESIPYGALDALLPVAEAAARCYPIDGHWNERGHAEVAAALAAYLLSNAPGGPSSLAPTQSTMEPE